MLNGIDWTAILMLIISTVLSLGGISLFLKNNLPKVEPWVALAKDAVETLADLGKALEPDVNGKVELTPEELAILKSDIETFKVQFALALKK